jgi:hypothetical protein
MGPPVRGAALYCSMPGIPGVFLEVRYRIEFA